MLPVRLLRWALWGVSLVVWLVVWRFRGGLGGVDVVSFFFFVLLKVVTRPSTSGGPSVHSA